jgi:hypothetical protein
MEMLGQGTFGQVAACYSDGHGCSVAVKVIKNQPAYYHQARVEVRGAWLCVGGGFGVDLAADVWVAVRLAEVARSVRMTPSQPTTTNRL